MPYKRHEMNVILFLKEDAIFADVEISQQYDSTKTDGSDQDGDGTVDFGWGTSATALDS